MKSLRELLRMFYSFPGDVWLGFIINLPGECGFCLRYLYWKARLRSLGQHVRIGTGVYFQNPKFISISANTWIDKNVIIMAGLDNSNREKIIIDNPDYIFAKGHVVIGANIHVPPYCIISGIDSGVCISDGCGLTANCKIYAFTHHYRSIKDPGNHHITLGSMVPAQDQCIISGPVFLGKNVGIALNSVILPGVSILSDSFVAINSVVHKGRYPSNSMLEGCPAKVVGARFKNGTA